MHKSFVAATKSTTITNLKMDMVVAVCNGIRQLCNRNSPFYTVRSFLLHCSVSFLVFSRSQFLLVLPRWKCISSLNPLFLSTVFVLITADYNRHQIIRGKAPLAPPLSLSLAIFIHPLLLGSGKKSSFLLFKPQMPFFQNNIHVCRSTKDNGAQNEKISLCEHDRR